MQLYNQQHLQASQSMHLSGIRIAATPRHVGLEASNNEKLCYEEKLTTKLGY